MGRNWMRAILVATLFLPMSFICFADEIRIPMSIKVDKFKEECLKGGLNLNDVDGFIENHGMSFKVFSYKNLTTEQLDLIKESTWKSLKK